MLRKLEAQPGKQYSEVLTSEEIKEARLMIRAAVACVEVRMARQRYSGRRIKPPASFEWYDPRYELQYSNVGRVFIASPNGVPVIGSGFYTL